MPTLKERITNFIQGFIPVSRRTIYDVRALPTSIASTLTTDRVLDIIAQAEVGDVEGLFNLYMEIISTGSHIQGLLVSRKEAVLSDSLNVQPYDKDNTDDVEAADACREHITKHDDWEDMCSHLLDSFLYPVSITEKTFKPSTVPELDYELGNLTIVPYQLITYIEGRQQIRDTDENGFPAGTRSEVDPARYLVHRGHLLKAIPDNRGGPMRSLIFWWLLSTMSRDWWARFLDRYGTPFLVGKYDQADDASRSILARAFAVCTKLGGLVISKESEVEIKQAAAADSGEAYKTFIELCNREMSKLVLGETISTDAQSTGMGSNTGKQHGAKRDEKRAGDARRLAKTIRNGLLVQFLQINGFKGRAPNLVWGSVSPEEQGAICDTLDSLSSANLEVGDDALPILSEKFGFEIQRKATPPAPIPGPGGVMPFSADGRLKKKADGAVDATAEAGAADLAAAFRGDLAPIRTIILNSTGPDQAIEEVAAFCATRFDPARTARILEDAMVAIAANGSVVHAD
jgi:phage gp29-like protein